MGVDLFDTAEPVDSGLVVVKCISLWEPWASLMATGAKTMETRSWPTSYRGPLLICASKKRDMESLALLRATEFKRGLAPLLRPDDTTIGDLVARLSFGCAVALVNLVACQPTQNVDPRDEQPFGDYTPGRFAWVTLNLRRLTPFPITGHQGLWSEAVRAERLESAHPRVAGRGEG